MAAPNPMGTARMSAMKVVAKVPVNNASAPKLAALPVAGFGEEPHQIQFRNHRRGFLKNEEKDCDDADDAAPAADSNKPFDWLLKLIQKTESLFFRAPS